jgi:hypothetical protein
LTIFIINGLLSELWEGIVHKIKKLPWPQAALNLLSLSLYPATLPLYHCCIWTDLVFLRRLSVKQTLVIFFSKIWIFSPMFIFWLYFESTGDYCKHYRHYNTITSYYTGFQKYFDTSIISHQELLTTPMKRLGVCVSD